LGLSLAVSVVGHRYQARKDFLKKGAIWFLRYAFKWAENMRRHQNSAKADELNLHGKSTAADGFAEECNHWRMLGFFYLISNRGKRQS